MTNSILDALTELDRALADPGSSSDGKDGKKKKPPSEKHASLKFHFFAQGRFPSSDLCVEVKSLGALGAPDGAISPSQARALQAISSPSRFGLGEKTLLDPQVRSSSEIAANEINLRWSEQALPDLMSAVAAGLGVEALQGQLHNLLIYGPGQFFKPHQDTEKLPGMVATLVLVLPSAHIGGDLLVRHGNKNEKNFESEQLSPNDEIRWCAFYADCTHEVLPVKEGLRVSLTLDLALPESAVKSAPPADPALLAAMRERLGLGEAMTQTLEPWVLLLDHQYSERGLQWRLLKGQDRPHVAALRAAAEALGLTVHLALTQVQQTWSAQETYSRWQDSDDDDDDEDVDEDEDEDGDVDEDEDGDYVSELPNVEPVELIDESMALEFWVDAQGRKSERSALNLQSAEVESFTETDRKFLVKQEYEGFTGNEGETLDCWYRRAALVIESPRAELRSRFKASFDSALARMRTQAKEGGHAAALAAEAACVADILKSKIQSKGREPFPAMADICQALPDTALAAELMGAFKLEALEPGDAPVIAQLERSMGEPWMLALMKVWTQPSDRLVPWRHCLSWRTKLPEDNLRRPWPHALVAFTQACLDSKWSEALLHEQMNAHVLALPRLLDGLSEGKSAARLAFLGKMLELCCELAAAIALLEPRGGPILQTLLAYVSGEPRLFPPCSLAPLVAIAPACDSSQALRGKTIDALRQMLAAPPRKSGDQSLRGIEWQCRCEDCTPAINWGESPSGNPLELAMAQSRRDHVSSKLMDAAAPVELETIRRGSPYKLLLTKRGDLHAQEQAERQRWERDLAALLG